MPECELFDYYRRREQQERARAEQAASPAIAGIHRAMAERYAALIRETTALNAIRVIGYVR